jgi:hypothetical protein
VLFSGSCRIPIGRSRWHWRKNNDDSTFSNRKNPTTTCPFPAIGTNPTTVASCTVQLYIVDVVPAVIRWQSYVTAVGLYPQSQCIRPTVYPSMDGRTVRRCTIGSGSNESSLNSSNVRLRRMCRGGLMTSTGMYSWTFLLPVRALPVLHET